MKVLLSLCLLLAVINSQTLFTYNTNTLQQTDFDSGAPTVLKSVPMNYPLGFINAQTTITINMTITSVINNALTFDKLVTAATPT